MAVFSDGLSEYASIAGILAVFLGLDYFLYRCGERATIFGQLERSNGSIRIGLFLVIFLLVLLWCFGKYIGRQGELERKIMEQKAAIQGDAAPEMK